VYSLLIEEGSGLLRPKPILCMCNSNCSICIEKWECIKVVRMENERGGKADLGIVMCTNKSWMTQRGCVAERQRT
jgi:hypothetical protein